MRTPKLTERELDNLDRGFKRDHPIHLELANSYWDLFSELGLETKGLNNLTKQNLSKDVKSLDVKG